MKQLLSIVALLALAGAAFAQRSVVVNTNGLLTQPTNFWTANSNAINAVVAGGGGGATTNASLLTAGTLADARLSTNVVLRTNVTQAVNAGGLLSGSSAALWDSASGREGVRVEFGTPVFGGTNDPRNWRTALGLGTNAAVTFDAISTTGDLSMALNQIDYLGEPMFTFNPGVVESRAAISFTGTNSAANRGQTITNLGLTNILRTTNASAASAPAWLLNLAPTNGIATIATNQVGMGWDEQGRFTLQTPVMPISVYETGSPSTPTIYIPGTVVVNRLSAIFFDSRVYASNIVGGPEGGVIPDSVMQASMTRPLTDWQDGSLSAGARGIPYILSNAVTQPETGSYVPYVTTVTNDTGNNMLQGRYTNLAGFRSLIEAEVAATNVTVTNAITLPAARRVIATIDSDRPAVSNTITLRTNNVAHGDTVDVRYVRTADASTVNIIDPFAPSTNALMWTRSMFWSYSTNLSPARWVPVGRTIGADVMLGALATNNSVPSGAVEAGTPYVADGASGSSFSGALVVNNVRVGTNAFDGLIYRPNAGMVAISRADQATTPNWVAGFDGTLRGMSVGSGFVGFASGAPTGLSASDVRLSRDAAGVLAQVVSTNAQQFRIYGNFTNSTNFRRLSLGHDGTNAYIRPESAGPLATNNIIHISGLPTTNTGLPSGVLWVSNGVVAVTP